MKKAILAMFVAAALSAPAGRNNPNADWMAGKKGVFAHYIPTPENFADWKEFDVDGLVAQIEDSGADYFGLTFGQNSGYYCAPNDLVEKSCGYEIGSRCAQRNIPREIGEKLHAIGKRFMVYLPGQPAFRDADMEAAFGFPREPANKDRDITLESANRWAEAIAAWSESCGDAVDAWWFDGTFLWLGFSNEISEIYAAAAKKGNPNAVVAFNPAVADMRFRPIKTYASGDDYLAGESDHPLDDSNTITGPRLDGFQWHMLTYLGTEWGRPDSRYPDCVWDEIIRRIVPKGGAITIDVNIDSKGRLCPSQMEQIKRIFAR